MNKPLVLLSLASLLALSLAAAKAPAPAPAKGPEPKAPAKTGPAAAKPAASVKPGEKTRDDAVEHNNLGIALLAQFKAADAEKEFRLAVEADPNYIPALVNVGISQLAQVRYEEAIQSLERALILAPDSVHAHYNLSLIYKIQGKGPDSIQHALAAVAGDQHDADLQYNLGACYQSVRDFDKAIAAYETALRIDPNLLPAYYSLGRAFIAKGDIETGKKYIQKHQELTAASNLPSSSAGLKYGEQGRYSFAMEDTTSQRISAEPLAPGKLTFVDATAASGVRFLHAGGGDPGSLRAPLDAKGGAATVLRDRIAPFLGSGVALADLDGDGADDLVFLNTGGKPAGIFLGKGNLTFAPAGPAASAIPAGAGMGIAAGDVDNDGDVDLLVTRYGGASLLLNDGKGALTAAQLPPFPDGFFAGGASFADVDHDGDLDLFVAGMLAPPNPPRDRIAFPGDLGGERVRLLRNNGNGTFTDVTQAAKLDDGSRRNVGAVFSDFDNDRDIDVAIARLGQGIALFTNNRDGTFTDVGLKAGLPAEGNYLGLAAGDYNRDGWMDLAATTWDSPLPRLFRNNGSGGFALDVAALADVPREGSGTLYGVAFADVDNDGLLDLLAVNGSDKGGILRLLRNRGAEGFEDAGGVSGLASIPARNGRGLAAGDLDGDGDLDLVVSVNGGPAAILRNDGGNANHWVTVNAKGLNSNKSGIGSKIEVKSGPLRLKTEIASGSGYLSSGSLKPLLGIGARERVDALRILWPGGVLQDEIRLASNTTHAVEELDRKGTSCPILYVWDGAKPAFVTDFLGGSAFGYLVAPATYNTPDTDEYVRVPRGVMRPRDGRYEVYWNNQLEETIYFDRASLLAVDHPEGTEIYPDEKLLEEPPFPAFRVFVTEHAREAMNVLDDAGRPVGDLVRSTDGRWPVGFKRLPFKGYATSHALTIDIGAPARRGARGPLLLLTAWIDYADSTSNLAAAQAGVTLEPPRLEALDQASGTWVTVLKQMGFPAGLPKTMTVDLRNLLPEGTTRVRIVTSMRIYWDQIQIADVAMSVPRVTRLDPDAAVLRWRGFPLTLREGGHDPPAYDYSRDDPEIHWKAHEGAYTRFGDVRSLLLAADDRYVITRGGDEIRLSFDASRVPPLPAGWTRTFLVYADGFGKDMDINSARPDRVEPLPYHAMKSFPYPASAAYPLDEETMRYIDLFNTRIVPRSIPPLAP